MKKKGATIEMDCAFNPTRISFRECEQEVIFSEYRRDGETCVTVKKAGEIVSQIRIPYYATSALAQFFTKTLNGSDFIAEIKK